MEDVLTAQARVKRERTEEALQVYLKLVRKAAFLPGLTHAEHKRMFDALELLPDVVLQDDIDLLQRVANLESESANADAVQQALTIAIDERDARLPSLLDRKADIDREIDSLYRAVTATNATKMAMDETIQRLKAARATNWRLMGLRDPKELRKCKHIRQAIGPTPAIPPDDGIATFDLESVMVSPEQYRVYVNVVTIDEMIFEPLAGQSIDEMNALVSLLKRVVSDPREFRYLRPAENHDNPILYPGNCIVYAGKTCGADVRAIEGINLEFVKMPGQSDEEFEQLKIYYRKAQQRQLDKPRNPMH